MGLFNRKRNENEPIAEERKEGHAIGEAELVRANQILRKYKDGKANLEAKLIENEEYWKLRQWRVRGKGKIKDFAPATAWLWSCIESCHSDVMDSYPTCNFRPRANDDTAEAEMLSSIVPVLLEYVDFEQTYDEVARYALKNGTGIYGVFWDSHADGGLGNIAVKKVDILNLFWEPGITDIQASENVFHTELVNNSILEQRYPDLKGKLSGKSFTTSKYLYDDTVDTSNKSVVVDWYYHTEYHGKRQLQYCKYVGTHVLYSTENQAEPPMAEQFDPNTGEPVIDPMTGAPVMVPVGEAVRDRGHYDHGKYPFVVQALFPVEGSICGYGLTDIGRDTQDEIDSLNRAITKNAVASATPRWFVKANANVNMEQYADLDQDFIRVEGNLGDEGIRRVDVDVVAGNFLSILNSKVEELKYVTANSDVMNGATPSGVTSASGIAALQEAGGKQARKRNKMFHRQYREVIYLILELIRQFYDVPRQFRITAGEIAPVEEFVDYSNANIKGQPINDEQGRIIGVRVPEFDISVTTEKANPYKKMEMNELALNFFNQGFFNPQMADQVLPCLQMMDFEGKDDVLAKVGENATLTKMLNQYQSLALGLAQKYEPETAEQLSQAILGQGGQPISGGTGGEVSLEEGEHPFVEKSRAAARASTAAE